MAPLQSIFQQFFFSAGLQCRCFQAKPCRPALYGIVILQRQRVCECPFLSLTLTPFHSSGIEDKPTIFYRLIRGSTDQTNKYDTFYLQQRQHNGWTHADIKVNSPLDYERIKVRFPCISYATHFLGILRNVLCCTGWSIRSWTAIC